MQKLRRCLAAIVLALTTSHAAIAAPLEAFINYSLQIAPTRVILPGRLYVPPAAAAPGALPRPLMVFLHGGGAAGTDNQTQVLHTPDWMLEEAIRRGAFLYVPQAASNWSGDSTIDNVMTMIDRAVSTLNANTDRLYATGYSNGGGGTWNLLSRHPGRFAAAMPLAGVLPATGFNPANLVGTPIVTAHARDDATVTVNRTRNVVNGILAAAGEPLPVYPAAGHPQAFLVSNPNFEFHRELAATAPPGSTINHFISRTDLDLLYFEPPDGGHTGVLGAFYSPLVYEWMFAHTLAVPEPAALPCAALAALASTFLRRRRAPHLAAGQ